MAHQHNNISTFGFQLDTLGAGHLFVIFELVTVHINSTGVRGLVSGQAKYTHFYSL